MTASRPPETELPAAGRHDDALDAGQMTQLRDAAELARQTLTVLLARIAQATDAARDLPLVASIAPATCVQTLAEANAQLVIALLQCHEDMEGAAQAAYALARTADMDALTSLPNRIVLVDRLTQSLTAARQRGGRAALLFVDLDQFKRVNDTLGHAAGDEVLKSAASAMLSAVREGDTVSRYGGDEFVLLLPEIIEPADAEQVARKVLAALAGVVTAQSGDTGVAASIGISVFPDDGDDAHTLMALADAAMFRAKRLAPASRIARAGAAMPDRAARGGRRSDWREARGDAQGGLLQEANERLLVSALASQEAREIAQVALREHSEGVAMVVHELRNPLMPIRAAAALMRSANPEQLGRMQGVIERQVGHLTRLVEDLMDVSRARSGKFHLHVEKLLLATVIREVREMCEPAIEARLQQLVIRVPDESVLLPGDAARLVQVFSNLVFNACKYTPESGHIAIEAVSQGATVVVTITDSGIGISAAALPSVFDVFVQERHATGYNREGLGIGLTVVRELVEAHGGTVTAHGAGLGLGSRFEVRLPCHAEAA